MRRMLRRGGQVLLLSAGFAVLAAVAGASVWLAWKSTAEAEWVNHSQEVKNQLTALQLSIRRAESGQRGYMLTGDPAYLDVYRASVDLILPRLAELRSMVADNPDQVARLERVAEITTAKHSELIQTAEMLAAGRQSDALEMLRRPDSLARMVAFTDLTLGMRDAEAELLAKRQAETAATNRWLSATTLIGTVTIIILAGTSLLLIRRQTRRLVEAQKRLAETNALLEDKVVERTADLQEANDELQRFAYIVSHDLRSPLVNIMGFTGELDAIRKDLLEEAARQSGGEDPRQQTLLSDFDEAIGFIKSSIGKMDRLIHAILALSRAGRRDFKPERLDLGPTLASLRDALMHQTQEVGAVIEIGKMPQIESDRVAIEQIFSNLLDNAVKYLTAGRPGRIEVTAGERGNFVLIRVADNGRGIDMADRDRVFDLFRRAGAQDRPGEGIGLAHVRTLVRSLGGSIRLDSELGKGSTFTVILPKQWKQEGARSASALQREETALRAAAASSSE